MKIRRFIKIFLMTAATAVGLSAIQTAQAVPLYPQCPAIGNNTGCAILIQWDGSNFTAAVDGSQGPYDGVEDTLVGIQNNSTDKTLSFVNLTGSNLFGFDGDGIDTYSFPVPDTSIFPTGYVFSGYEGPITYFTSTDSNNGSAHFIAGLAPGANTYFALEEPPSVICPNNDCGGIVTGGGNSIPEPGTVLLLGAGLVGLGFARSRKAS